MIDDRIILNAERLRDELQDYKSQLRRKYPKANGIVAIDEIKRSAARLAEKWMVEIGPNREVGELIPARYLGDINVRFQRLLTFSEHATKRSRYDTEISGILDGYTRDFVIPLKQARANQGGGQGVAGLLPIAVETNQEVIVETFLPTAFVGQSFAPEDKGVNDCVAETLKSLGIKVVTGEKPKADRVSEKIKQRIDAQYLFVGIFTRRDKIARKPEWTTSTWVIDEKAYATGKGKKLILLREDGVSSIGGVQGDYEYITFARDNLHGLVLKLVQIFHVKLGGLGD